jgi:Neurotransmitter-gated ion-channel ligand binding domain
MNVEYFPYDEQSCFMKFGSWTYNGAQVDLKHLDQVITAQLSIIINETYKAFNILGSRIKSCSNRHRFIGILLVSRMGCS